MFLFSPAPALRQWVRLRFESYASMCLIAAACLVPVTFHYGAPDPVMVVKLTVLWILIVVATGAACVVAVERSYLQVPSLLGRLAALYGGVCVMTTLTSEQPTYSLMGRHIRYGGLIPQLLYVALLLVLVSAFRNRPATLRTVAWAMTASSSLVALYVLVQAAGMDPLAWTINGEPTEFPVATVGNSNFAGAYLATALPFAVYATHCAKASFSRNLLLLSLGFHCLAIWFTHTRGGLLAALVTLGFLIFVERRRLMPRVRLRMAVGVSVLLLLGAVAASRIDAGGAAPSVLRTETLTNRINYWRSAWQLFLDHPWLGTGPDTFYANYGRYEITAQAAAEPLIGVDKPHNVPLERATDSGLGGAVSFLALFGVALYHGCRRLAEGIADRPLLLAFVCSVVAYLVQGFFSIDVVPLAFMGWLGLGGITVLADPRLVRSERYTIQKDRRPLPPWLPRWLLHVSTVGATVVLLQLGTQPLRADMAAHRGELAEAMRLQPWAATYVAQAADLARAQASNSGNQVERAQHLERAHMLYVRALQLQPDTAEYLTAVASLNTYWSQIVDPGRFTVADRWWRLLLENQPRDQVLRDQYTAIRSSMRRSLLALERRAAVDGAAGPWLAAARGHLAMGEIADARRSVDNAARIAPEDPEVRRLAAEMPY